MKTKNQYRAFLDELLCEYCQSDKYCLLKEFLISSHPDPRMLMQLKCIEKYKYEISKAAEKEIDWQETLIQWAESGLAKRYAEIFDNNPDISFKELYNKVVNEADKKYRKKE